MKGQAESGVTPGQERTGPIQILAATPRHGVVHAFEGGLRSMKGHGVSFQSVEKGTDALKVLRSLSFDAVILDGGLQDVPAPTVFQTAVARHGSALGFLFTDQWDEMINQSMRRMGFVACIPLEEAFRVDFARRVLEHVLAGRGNKVQAGIPTKPELKTRAIVSRSSFGRILEVISNAAVVTDGSGEIVFANSAFLTAAGLGRRDPSGRGLAEFFPEVGPRIVGELSKRKSGLLQLRRASGNTQVVSAHFVDFPIDGEAFIGIVF